MNKIREYRKKKGITMKELGKAVGVSESTISLYETGKHEPDLLTIGRIADFLGVTVDDLLGRTDDGSSTDHWPSAIRERLRRDPAYRLLFDAAENAKPEHLRAAAAMLKSLEGSNDAD
jgi:transcriptional regulator with XRE-family HTH domain